MSSYFFLLILSNSFDSIDRQWYLSQISRPNQQIRAVHPAVPHQKRSQRLVPIKMKNHSKMIVTKKGNLIVAFSNDHSLHLFPEMIATIALSIDMMNMTTTVLHESNFSRLNSSEYQLRFHSLQTALS